MLGRIADLVCLSAVFVALKLDGVVIYSWKVGPHGNPEQRFCAMHGMIAC
jgi:hypothetical protein